MISILAFNFYMLLPAHAISTVSVKNPLNGTSDFIFYTNTTTVGFKFNATLNIDVGTDIFAWQVRMNYNATILNATRAWIASSNDPDYIFLGEPTIRPSPSLTNGSVLIADTSLDTAVNFATPKKLGTVEFKILKLPPSSPGSQMSSTLDIYNVDTVLLDFNLNEITPIRTSGHYEIDTVPSATQISISVSPSTLEVGGTVRISGSIATVPPNGSKSFVGVNVSIWHKTETSGAFAFFADVLTNNTSGYFYDWSTSGSVKGLHQFQASWDGNDTYSGAVSNVADLNLTAPPTQISIGITPGTLNYSETARISGVIEAVPPNASETFAGIVVTLWHRIGTSGAFTFFTNVLTDHTSRYVFNWSTIGNTDGLHQFRASWSGNDTYNGAVSSSVNLTVVIPAGSPTVYVTNPLTGTRNFTFYSGTASMGYRFNAVVEISNGTNVAAWQVAINYNATYLNVTNVLIPSSDTNYVFYGVGTFPVTPVITPGSVLLGDITLPVTSVTFTTPKVLAIIEFQIMATPLTGAGNKLTSTLNISNPTSTFVLDDTPNEIPIFRANGLYKLYWTRELPSSISLDANPTVVNAGQLVTIDGAITPAGPNANVTIYHRMGTAGNFTEIALVKTDNSSHYSYTWTTNITGTHQFMSSWPGDEDYFGAQSTTQTVTVKALSTISINADPNQTQIGGIITISGAVMPARSGLVVTILYGHSDSYYYQTLATVQTDSHGTYSYSWKTTELGGFDIKANWSGDDAYNGAETKAIIVSVVPKPPSITLNPTSGPVGTKVVVNGFNFTISEYTIGYLEFDDQLVSLIIAVDDKGTFNATFNIPLSESGLHTVKVVTSQQYPTYELATIQADFTVIDTTPLYITTDVGSEHTPGETAEFYVQSTFKGVPINMTSVETTLHKPDGTTQTLTAQIIASGLYKITYPIPMEAPTGTYALAINGDYQSGFVNSEGTTIETFLLNPATPAVTDTTPLDITADVGSPHIPGESAEFYVESTFNGVSINMTSIQATLYKPDGSTQTLTAKGIATGLYKITYAIPTDALNGTYALVIKGSYQNASVDSRVATTKTFLLNPASTTAKSDVAPTQIPYVYLAIAAILAIIAAAGWTMFFLRKRKQPPTVERI